MGGAVCPGNDEDRGDGRAGKRTERWCRAKGKLGEEGLSLLTRHTRAGRGQARKLFGMERAVSCGSPEPGRWGTELDLGSSPSLDNDHGPAAVGTSPERTGLLGSGDSWFDLWLREHAEYLPAKRQQSGAPPVGKEAEVADANEAFGEQVPQETAQKLIER